jgi:hypothetical protein
MEVCEIVEKVIAVADDLSGLKEALVAQGYDVVSLEEDGLKRASAVVVTGVDKDFMMMEDIKTRVPVIDASGKSSQEIVSDINNYFRRIH